MATQTDVQQLIQGLGPSSTNDGNPNTAYNNPMIPMSDALGNWAMPVLPNAASVQPLDLASIQLARNPNDPWNQPYGGTGEALRKALMPVLPSGWNPAPSPSTPAPPVTGGGGSGPPGIDGVPYIPAPDINKQPLNTPSESGVGAGGMGGGGPMMGGGVIQGPDAIAWANSFGNSVPRDTTTGLLDANNFTTKDWDTTFNSSAVGNIIGNVLDVFLPGDAYTSKGFDVSNMVTGLLNALIPGFGPLRANVVDTFLHKINDSVQKMAWVPEFVKKALKSHVDEQVAERKRAEEAKQANTASGGFGGGMANLGNSIGNNFLGFGNGWISNPTPERTGTVDVRPMEVLRGGGGDGGGGDGGGGGGRGSSSGGDNNNSTRKDARSRFLDR